MNLQKDPEFVADYLNGMIVQQILTIMEDEGITPRKLAEKMGMSWGYVMAYLSEDNLFTINALVRFCRALDCNVEVVIKKEIDDEN